MGFLAICTALYDYRPQSTEELGLKEGELLYIIEKDGDDDWWKARKKADGEDEEEPEGLIPSNYVQEATPIHKAKALYDYSRQTDEEVSFSEEAVMEVFDNSDPDWTLVGINNEFGFAPANYIEITKHHSAPVAAAAPVAATPVYEPEPEPEPEDEDEAPPAKPARPGSLAVDTSPAANLAKVLGARGTAPATAGISAPTPPTPHAEVLDEEQPGPALPRRPTSGSISSPPQSARLLPATHESNNDEESSGIVSSPPYNRASHRPQNGNAAVQSPGGFRLYSISEMVSVMGRRKKMPTTIGINIATGTIMISPEKSRDGPSQEWTADKLNHYSIEGKHVFLELVKPSKSLDLHAGAKDTAQEIVSALGEIAGAQKAEGFKEVMAAAASGGDIQKKGVVLYDFMAQGDDEVTVAVGDEIIILDDEKSDEWWNIRRLKNGSEGVMPSSYIEITGILNTEPASRPGVNAGKSVVEQNRLEEERLAREAARLSPSKDKALSDPHLPERGSSLTEEETVKTTRKDKKSGRGENKSRSKPDTKKVRTWTDYSGSFKVDAQFIGIADGKIHLHKVNGVKIAVPVAKMSPEDIEYVEKVMNESIEDHIPVADLIKLKRKSQALDTSGSKSGATIEAVRPRGNGSDYDWFEFFLNAGVGPHQCERYAQAMIRDSMDESVLPDITTDTLRAIGIKEGDALKVMKHLDQKFARSRTGGTEGSQSGIFSGPGGALHNNTRRGRPEATRQASDVVDASAFEQSGQTNVPTSKTNTPVSAEKPAANGFDDNAWDVKQATQPSTREQPKATKTTPATQPLSDNLQALSLLDKPLEPTPAAPPRPASQPQVAEPTSATTSSPASQQLHQNGANPAFFAQVNQVQPPRQRPHAPQPNNLGSSLLSPPPRPTSAPQNPAQSQFALQPLYPQLTGLPNSARPAGPGQSLDELTAQRMQTQYLQAQQTAYGPNMNYGQFGNNGLMPQPTGFLPQQTNQFQQPYLNGNVAGSPFADPRIQIQPTGYGLQPGPAPGSLNSMLPPALVPERTGFQPSPSQVQMNGFNQGIQAQPTGFQQLQAQPTGFGQFPGQSNGFGNVQLPPVPPIPQQTPAPLIPQKTGPAPQVKFGVKGPPKLVPQPTSQRANLAHATPQNPFGLS